MINLKIDPEFQSQIPPLTNDEFKQLEENISHFSILHKSNYTESVELRQYVDFHQMMLAIYPSSPLSKIKSA